MQNKPAAMGFIFITLLIDVTGLGIIIPVMPQLIEQLIHGNLSEASRVSGWLTFAYAITQFCCAPIIGNLSDQYGRRPVLLLSLLGFGIDYILLAFAPTLGWLLIGRIIAGFTGASFTTASAYIADVSTPEKRAQNFGMIGAAFGIGFILGPTLGSVLSHVASGANFKAWAANVPVLGWVDNIAVRFPFLVAALLCLVNALYGYFILPESLAANNRRKFQWARANPIGSLKHLRKHPAIMGLIASLILIHISGHAVQSNWSFYTMYKFHWSPAQVGYSLSFVGLVIGLVQGGLIRWVLPKLGVEKSIYVGLSFFAVGFTLFAFATQGWMMYAFMIPYGLGGIAGPAIQGYISNNIPANEQGELQGALTSLMSATAIVGPPLMTNLFGFFTAEKAPINFPGAPFVAAALLTLTSALLAYRTLKAVMAKR